MCLSLIISCNDATDEDLGISGSGSLSATVDGSSFTSLSSTVGAAVTNGIAAIQGSTSDGTYIRMNITNYNGLGTYTTGGSFSNQTSISYGTISPSIATWIASSILSSSSGTIEITEDTATTVSGTFSFVGYNGNTDRKEVTNGVFSAPKN